MKKMKLALIALGSVIGIGSAVAATSQADEVYYTSATGSNIIPGQKGEEWDCLPASVTCAYLANPDGSRTKILGNFTEL